LGLKLPQLLGDEGQDANDGPTVIWLEAQSCSGCSVSLLNSIYYGTIDELLLNTLNLEFHPTIMAGAGSAAIAAAAAARAETGYVLIVEGGVPTGAGGKYAELWPGLTVLDGVKQFAQDAGFVMAVGSCSAYGGVNGGEPNPTGVMPLSDILPDKEVINVPGCPSHPDWVVGTVAHLIEEEEAPLLDSKGRPELFFEGKVHNRCPNYDAFEAGDYSIDTCLYQHGCKGPNTRSDCPQRKWHSPAKGEFGVNWCIGSRSPCLGCTEPEFPDGLSPFYGRPAGIAQTEPQVAESQHNPPEAATGNTATGDENLTAYERNERYRERMAELRREKERLEKERLERLRREADAKRKAYLEAQAERRAAYERRRRP